MSVRIAVLVSGGGTNLQALLDAQSHNGLGGGEIALVVASRPGVYALERAKNAGIPAIVIPRADMDAQRFDSALCGELSDRKIDLVVLAGFLSVLGPLTLARFRDSVINVHPALIPSFSGPGMYGLHVHKAALERGVKVTGATVHLVNEVVDGGKILLQKAVDVLPGDTPEALQRRVMEQAEWQILPKAVLFFCEKRKEPKENDCDSGE